MDKLRESEFDIVDIYYSALSKIKILSRKEERALLLEYKECTDPERLSCIKAKICESNLRLVFGFAKKLWDQVSPTKLQELIAQGNIGLLLALEKFDPKYNVRFCTYAGHWVLMAMRKTHIEVVKAPVGKAIIIEDETKIPDKPYTQDYGAPIFSIQQKHIIHTWLRFLSDRERYIVVNSFSLKDPNSDTLSLRDMASVLGLSSERVRQLKAQALGKLSLWVTYHIKSPQDL